MESACIQFFTSWWKESFHFGNERYKTAFINAYFIFTAHFTFNLKLHKLTFPTTLTTADNTLKYVIFKWQIIE